MPPQGEPSLSLFDADAAEVKTEVPSTNQKREWKIVWRNVVIFLLLHIGFLYGAYLFLFKAKWATKLFAFLLYIFSGFGITAGAHRLWSHKSYKARWPLRLMLTILNTVAFQDSVLDWARDHRLHHKYSETDADPHNATRGLFFSHIGWLMLRKHPEIKAKADTIDMSDLYADPMLQFQKKYYAILMPLACFIVPSFIPMLWGESLWNGYFVCAIFRYVYVLHGSWMVNSLAHMFGTKPYDNNINPVENKIVALLVLGEGFHNYHHTFPWDYKTAELGGYSMNLTKMFIDTMAKIGLAYDLKTVTDDVIENRVKRTGDGSHGVWGWDDKDVPTEHKEMTRIVNPEKTE